jgi:hypothetical protein
MGLVELAMMTKSRLISMALAGTLGPREMWLAAKGATKYAAAVAAGRVRPEAEAGAFAGVCSRCPEWTLEPTSKVGVVAGYCGRLDGVDGGGVAGPVCGCLVSLTVAGVVYPAGKAVVEGEVCPQGRR